MADEIRLDPNPIQHGDCEDVSHKELNTFLKFSALLNSSLDMEVVLDTAMRWAEEFMDAEASSVFELDSEKGLLYIRHAR
jgi:hypothetical protein